MSDESGEKAGCIYHSEDGGCGGAGQEDSKGGEGEGRAGQGDGKGG